MKIVITNLYGIQDGRKAYYRKLKDCFDFVSDKKFCSELTENEAANILNHKDAYLKMYNAEKMSIEL